MASAVRNPSNPNFILSPHQQDLLFAALNSNKTNTFDALPQQSPTEATIMPPAAFDNSPMQQAPGSGTLNGFEDSPYVDYDYDFDGDGNFDDYDFSNISQGQMIGNLPGSSSDGDADTHDKRTHPEDDEDDEEGGGKRREGDDKSSKKPGRKPLTSEPTSKRKAQNRAAQRAFRERKEKHLKDLETKVQDLEKASESANHENSVLRAQMEKMAVELKQYRKRLASSGPTGPSPPLAGGLPSYLTSKGLGNTVNNPNDVNFQFEFPKFGRLPGPPVLNASTVNGSSTTTPPAPSSSVSASNNGSTSSFAPTVQHTSSFGSSNSSISPFGQSGGSDMAQFSALFTASPQENVSKGSSFEFTQQPRSNASRSSMDSANGRSSTGHNTSHSSPSASSTSNNGLSSSAGTSPEPYTQSPPSFKPENTLSTIGEERNDAGTIEGEASFCEKLSMACGNPNNPIPRTMSNPGVESGPLQTPGFDINSIDWFAQQNGNQFDPQLFGDYREPQDSILSTGLYDDSFFNEAFALPEFNSPFTLEASPAPKKDIVSEIDAKLNEEDEVVPGEDTAQMLTCTNMWEKIQACPRVQNGEVDMDSLCTQLQQKAKCSGDGPVIQEKDFKDVMQSMFPDKALSH